jgi:hypothetical protein
MLAKSIFLLLLQIFWFFFCVATPQLFLGHIIVEVSRSHKIRYTTNTHTNTHPVEILCTCDEPVTEAATYTARYRNNRLITMPSSGFETAIPAIKFLQTYTLNRAATGISTTFLRYRSFVSVPTCWIYLRSLITFYPLFRSCGLHWTTASQSSLEGSLQATYAAMNGHIKGDLCPQSHRSGNLQTRIRFRQNWRQFSICFINK